MTGASMGRKRGVKAALSGLFPDLGGFAGGAAFGDGADLELCVAFVDLVGIEGFALAALVPFGGVFVLGKRGAEAALLDGYGIG